MAEVQLGSPGGVNFSGDKATDVTSNNAERTFGAFNESGGVGLYGQGSDGVMGRSMSSAGGGRGGVFQSNGAQLRLVPSDQGTPPEAGEVGDIFLSSDGVLFLCRVAGAGMGLGSQPAQWQALNA